MKTIPLVGLVLFLVSSSLSANLSSPKDKVSRFFTGGAIETISKLQDGGFVVYGRWDTFSFFNKDLTLRAELKVPHEVAALKSQVLRDGTFVFTTLDAFLHRVDARGNLLQSIRLKEDAVEFNAPGLLELPDGRLVVGTGRRYSNQKDEELIFINLAQGEITKRVPNPGFSYGDLMLLRDGRIWVPQENSFGSDPDFDFLLFNQQGEFLQGVTAWSRGAAAYGATQLSDGNLIFKGGTYYAVGSLDGLLIKTIDAKGFATMPVGELSSGTLIIGNSSGAITLIDKSTEEKHLQIPMNPSYPPMQEFSLPTELRDGTIAVVSVNRGTIPPTGGRLVVFNREGELLREVALPDGKYGMGSVSSPLELDDGTLVFGTNDQYFYTLQR